MMVYCMQLVLAVSFIATVLGGKSGMPARVSLYCSGSLGCILFASNLLAFFPHTVK